MYHYVFDDAHYTMVIIIDGTDISRGVKATSEALRMQKDVHDLGHPTGYHAFSSVTT